MSFITSKVISKWGGYRPWLVLASLPPGFSLILMFTNIAGS
ncbi:MAG: hypothetical protein KJN68_01440 [Bacteroidia bacterium]|nr:hypothetical protein [Bacteroidia bacterium]